jgi:hypothetical protein
MNTITAFLIFIFDLSGLSLKKANVRQRFVLLGQGERKNVKWQGMFAIIPVINRVAQTLLRVIIGAKTSPLGMSVSSVGIIPVALQAQDAMLNFQKHANAGP